MKTNQVSDIITTQFGYHIIKLSEKFPAKKLELAKVSQDIKDYLKGQAVSKQLPEYMEKAKKDAGVQILDPKLKPTDSALETSPAPTGKKTP
jgi:peptidyl-prolyl cis-trans isomerase C